jgi:hypothetical protein
MTGKFPILRQYRGAWPIHEIMKQFLGSQKSNYKKDTEAELAETGQPDREAIKAYLNSLPSQKRRIQASDESADDDQEEKENREGDEDWEDCREDRDGVEDGDGEEDGEEKEDGEEDEDEVSDDQERDGLSQVKKKTQRSKTIPAYMRDKSNKLNIPPAKTVPPTTNMKNSWTLVEKSYIEKKNVQTAGDRRTDKENVKKSSSLTVKKNNNSKVHFHLQPV